MYRYSYDQLTWKARMVLKACTAVSQAPPAAAAATSPFAASGSTAPQAAANTAAPRAVCPAATQARSVAEVTKASVAKPCRT